MKTNFNTCSTSCYAISGSSNRPLLKILQQIGPLSSPARPASFVVLQMSSTTIDVPDPTLPRLFIGGLTPSISTPALLRLLSKFAKPGPIHRHPHRPFAHVTIDPYDQTSLTRCIASLNNTTWCGTLLRVQRARKHFWHRLQQEWELEDEGVNVENVDGDGGVEEDEQEVHHLPFGQVAKGRHTRFNFPDMRPEETVQLLQFDDMVSDDDGREQEGLSHQCSVQPDESDVHNTPCAPFKQGIKTKSVALSSTMDLFGLQAQPSVGALTANATEANVENHATEVDATRPLKRPRVAPLEKSMQRLAESTEREPHAINVESEKKAALSVLHDMFPRLSAPKMARNEIIAAHRRLGLFRKLPVTESALDSSGSPSSPSRGIPQPLKSHQIEFNTATVQRDGNKTGDKVRRVGLYRKLMSIFSAAASQPQQPAQKK